MAIMTGAKSLEERILEAKNAYYSGEAIMSDSEYDALENRLRKLNPNSPVLETIGTDSFGDTVKCAVGPKMFSTDKSLDMKSLESYWNRVGRDRQQAVVSSKVDGLALSLKYENGSLVQSVTRGNGLVGVDVTAKANYIGAIPKTLTEPFTGLVRGECFMTYADFNKLNEVLANGGEDKQSNPRNSTAALLNAKNVKSAGKKLALLSFEAYGVYEPDSDVIGAYASYTDQLAKAEALGFNTVPFEIINGKAGFESDHFENFIKSLDHPCDGVVIRVNDNKKAEQLGAARNYLNAVTAYKFAPEVAIAVVDSIEWNVGSKKISPVVVLREAVELDGAMITRVAGHSVKNLIEMGAAPGCEVAVVRSGGVIPKLVKMRA